MQNVTPESKLSMQKTLALLGLLVVIIVSAFLAVQLVKVFPSAVSTLANLAGSVYNHNPNEALEFAIKPNRTIVNNGETFTATWDKLAVPGSYSFTFTCTDGVAIDIKSSNNTFTSANCGAAYVLGEVDSVSVTVQSEKNRYTEIPYTITFFRTNATTVTATNSSTFTVVNPKISSPTIAFNPEPTPPTYASSTSTTTVGVPDPSPTSPVTPPVATSTPVVVATTTPAKPVTPPSPKPVVPVVPPTPVITYTYALPVSQPNGFTDLAVVYLGTGFINNSGQFVKTNVVRVGQPGAFQFSVHNIGTKTSEPWTFTTKSPGGSNFTSGTQAALKPNERAVLTVSFPAFTSTSQQPISALITTSRDVNSNNNSFSTSAILTN